MVFQKGRVLAQDGSVRKRRRCFCHRGPSSNVVDCHQVTLPGAMGGLYYEAATGMYYVFESLRVRARIVGDRKVNNIENRAFKNG